MSIQSIQAELNSIDSLLYSYKNASSSRALSYSSNLKKKLIPISNSGIFNKNSKSQTVTPNKFMMRSVKNSKPIELLVNKQKLNSEKIQNIVKKLNNEKSKIPNNQINFKPIDIKDELQSPHNKIGYHPYGLKEYEFLRFLPNYRARSLGQDLKSEKYEIMHMRKKLMDEYSGLIRTEHWLKFNDKLKIGKSIEPREKLPPLYSLDEIANKFKKTLHFSFQFFLIQLQD